jgi:hypothetical protein
MMPGRKAASLEVVKPALALEILVQALGAVPFLDEPHELLPAAARRQRAKEILGRLALAVRPLDDEPHVFAYRWIPSVVVGGTTRRKAKRDHRVCLVPWRQGMRLNRVRANSSARSRRLIGSPRRRLSLSMRQTLVGA